MANTPRVRRVPIVTLGVVFVLAVVRLGPASAAGVAGAPRLLYVGDWSGTRESTRWCPAGRRPPGQVTLSRTRCGSSSDCRSFEPVPSPDGRYLVFSGDRCFKALFVARADGSGRRRLATSNGACPITPFGAAWAPDSSRVALRGVERSALPRQTDRANGSSARGHSRPGRGTAARSPTFAGANSWYGTAVSSARSAPAAESSFAWSPTGKWIAYGSDRLVVVHPDGSGRRQLRDSYARAPAWSADGRYVAYSGREGLDAVDVVSGVSRVLSTKFTSGRAWSPRGHVLAFGSTDGLTLADARSAATRVLNLDRVAELAWASDGRSLAYVSPVVPGLVFDGADLRVTDLLGHGRTVVAADAIYGGHVNDVVWTRPPAATRYRPPTQRTIATVAPQELTAPWPVERLATDGDGIAYVSCGHVFV